MIRLSSPHICSYFSNRIAKSFFHDPNQDYTDEDYENYLQQGFRRSGQIIYKPCCQHCAACISLRVNVNEFKPSRSQKRLLKINEDIKLNIVVPKFSNEHYALYKTYLSVRHAGGSMEKHDKQDYFNFIVNSRLSTLMFELRHDNTLVALSVVDVLENSLSAVYTFYDPIESVKRSLGSYAILAQLHIAKIWSKKWLYLGYWIKDLKKMDYKQNFKPCEILYRGKWQAFNR